MYVVSLSEDSSVKDVYDTDVYLDQDIETFPITEEEKDLIWKSGNHSIWAYENGAIVRHTENHIKMVEFDIRVQRDRLLAEIDWTQAADVPQATKDKWAPYRQALRDLPQDPAFPWYDAVIANGLSAVPWPTKP